MLFNDRINLVRQAVVLGTTVAALAAAGPATAAHVSPPSGSPTPNATGPSTQAPPAAPQQQQPAGQTGEGQTGEGQTGEGQAQPTPPPGSAPPAAPPAADRPRSGSDECTIVGTEGNDTLSGTARRDVICGLGGADVIRGLGGDDILDGGPGRDRIDAGPGRDAIRARDGGRDDVTGGSGRDSAQLDRRDRARSIEVRPRARVSTPWQGINLTAGQFVYGTTYCSRSFSQTHTEMPDAKGFDRTAGEDPLYIWTTNHYFEWNGNGWTDRGTSGWYWGYGSDRQSPSQWTNYETGARAGHDSALRFNWTHGYYAVVQEIAYMELDGTISRDVYGDTPNTSNDNGLEYGVCSF